MLMSTPQLMTQVRAKMRLLDATAEQLHRLGYQQVTVISCNIDDVCKAQF